MTRVVDAWDEGYRAGVHDATHPASSPTINPYQRSDVDADHVIAEAARAWWRADQRVTAEIEALDSVKAAHQRLTEALASEAAWLSRQPGQGAGSRPAVSCPAGCISSPSPQSPGGWPLPRLRIRSGCWPSSSCATAPTPSPSALSDPPATR